MKFKCWFYKFLDGCLKSISGFELEMCTWLLVLKWIILINKKKKVDEIFLWIMEYVNDYFELKKNLTLSRILENFFLRNPKCT